MNESTPHPPKLGTWLLRKIYDEKYFGDEPALGKIMDIDGYPYKITGVAKDAPANSNIKFDFFLSYATFRYWRGEEWAELSWEWQDFHSYVLLEPGSNVAAFSQKFNGILEASDWGKLLQKDSQKEEFTLQPLADIHLYSHLMKEYEPEEQGDGDAVFFLTLIAFFVLLIAWTNYINLSTARSIERAKEVGVRKTIGAYHTQLIYQFMVESFVTNFLAIIMSLVIVISGIHYFNFITHSKLNLNFLTDSVFWTRVVVVLLFGSFMSGLYPAFVISSFQPLSVLKGKFSADGFGVLLRRVLVVFQFAASVTLIAGTIIVYLQLRYMSTSNLGFDMIKTMVIHGPNPVNDEEYGSKFKQHTLAFKEELLKLSGISAVTSSSFVPGHEIRDWQSIRTPETPEVNDKLAFTVAIDHNYFSTYGIKVVTGIGYRQESSQDTVATILNASAVRILGLGSLEGAIGKKIIFGDHVKTVIGIVTDYNQRSLKMAVTPMVYELDDRQYNFYTVKLADDNYQTSIANLRKLYETFWPKAAFDYFFLDEFYNHQYDSDRKFSRVFTLFAGFAIFVACLGLFGLSSFSALQRTKEIGIRKVLGAEVMNIVYLVTKLSQQQDPIPFTRSSMNKVGVCLTSFKVSRII